MLATSAIAPAVAPIHRCDGRRRFARVLDQHGCISNEDAHTLPAPGGPTYFLRMDEHRYSRCGMATAVHTRPSTEGRMPAGVQQQQ